jgi:hypothetical protein
VVFQSAQILRQERLMNKREANVEKTIDRVEHRLGNVEWQVGLLLFLAIRILCVLGTALQHVQQYVVAT